MLSFFAFYLIFNANRRTLCSINIFIIFLIIKFKKKSIKGKDHKRKPKGLNNLRFPYLITTNQRRSPQRRHHLIIISQSTLFL